MTRLVAALLVRAPAAELACIDEMGDGFRQEIRAYWNEDSGQDFWTYVILHEKPPGVVRVFNAIANSQHRDVFANWN